MERFFTVTNLQLSPSCGIDEAIKEAIENALAFGESDGEAGCIELSIWKSWEISVLKCNTSLSLHCAKLSHKQAIITN